MAWPLRLPASSTPATPCRRRSKRSPPAWPMRSTSRAAPTAHAMPRRRSSFPVPPSRTICGP